MSSSGRFVWFDLLTNDAEAAKAFYTKVAGWTTRSWGEDSYALWVNGETPIGGVMQFPQVPPYWMAHVSVDDVDAAARRAEELGARIQQPPTDIPQVGRFAVIADPQGAQFALLHSNTESAVPDGQAIGGIGWRELHTTDHEGAWEFYRQLFGWQPATTFDMGPAGIYRVFRHPDDPQDGMMGGMYNGATLESKAPHWLYYINADTMEGALNRIREAGGRVLEEPSDVPGGGTSAPCMDPQGARFAVFSLR